MATTTTPRTGTAHAAGPAPAPLPEHTNVLGERMLDLATGIHDDAERASQALASLAELLGGCSPDHEITASYLLQLLEPVRGQVETMVGDMLTLLNADNWTVQPGLGAA